MSTSDECCGWLGWAELAGIDADGSRLRGSALTDPSPGTAATVPRRLPLLTAVLRRALPGRDGAPR